MKAFRQREPFKHVSGGRGWVRIKNAYSNKFNQKILIKRASKPGPKYTGSHKKVVFEQLTYACCYSTIINSEVPA